MRHRDDRTNDHRTNDQRPRRTTNDQRRTTTIPAEASMRATVLVTAGVIAGWSMALIAQRGAAEQTVVIENAPTDRVASIPKDKLDQYLKEMDAKKLATLRMIEGGKFNVNIRRITGAETALVHPNTIDTWVVIDGAGTLTTGGRIENGKIVGGQSHPIKVGDVEFIPSGLPHGVSGVNGHITWLNIRWDNDWKPQ